MSDGYVPIRLQDFISGSQAKSDIYICLPGPAKKYVKVLHKGQAFDPARLQSYQEHKIDTVYLRSEDFSSYVYESTRLAEQLFLRKDVDSDTTARFLNRIADAVLSEIVHTEIHAQSLKHAQTVTSHFLSSIQKQPNIALVFKSLEELGEEFTRHSIGVSVVATMMALRLKWESDKTMQIVQCGGFLHDIGFRELPKGLHLKARAEMTSEEVKLYESHPYRGVQLLQSVSIFPSEVISVVYDHHEIANGSGYPRGLTTSGIYPVARVISLADLFCHQALSSRFNPTPKSGREVVEYLEAIHSHDFPGDLWKALNFLVGRPTLKKKLKKGA